MKIKTSIKNEILDILNKDYDRISLHLDENGEELWIVENWDAVRKFQEIASEIYPEEFQITDDVYDTSAIDKIFNNWSFADEYDICNCCGKAVYAQDPYKSPDRWVDYEGCEILCGDCVRENPDSYIDSLVNNPKSANHLLKDEQLENLGWELQDTNFANGWYGRTDKPEDVLQRQNSMGFDVIFQINYTNPFEVGFTFWKKVAK